MLRLLLTALFALAAPVVAAPSTQAPAIRVQVRDRGGAPIEGATIETFEDSHAGRVKTGADGWCTLDLRAEPGPPFRLRVEAPGFFHNEVPYTRITEISITLLRAVAMNGRVVARDTREPIARALVEFVHPMCRNCAPDRAVCDGEGRFTFASVPADTQATFFASADGYAKQNYLLGLSATAPPHELELEHGFEIHGHVVAADSRAPITKARVATRAKAVVETATDDQGRFSLRVLPDAVRGSIDLEAEAEGFCKLRFFLSADAANSPRELDLALFRPAFITGVVVDGNGTPLPGAEVAVREENNWLSKRRAQPIDGERIPFDELPIGWFVASGHPNHTVIADGSGRFRTQGVVPWSPRVMIQIEHASVQRFTYDAGPIGEPGSTFEARVAPPAPPTGPRVRGTVRVNGEGVFGTVEWQGATRNGKAVLDARGNFEIVGAELGKLELHPMKLQTRSLTYGSLFDGETARLELVADRDARQDFELKQELVSMHGRVATRGGKPCAKAAVSATEREHDTRGTGVTDAEGNFVISVPKLDGPWRVVASWGPELFEKNGVAASGEIVFEVPDLGRAKVRFVDRRTRVDVFPASIAWRRKGETRFQLRDLMLDALDQDGNCYPFQIPYGEFELLAWSPRPGYAPAPMRTFVLAEGDAPPLLEFELEQGLAIDLALTSGSAAPIREERDRVWLLEASPSFFGESKAPWTRENVQLPTYADRTRRVTFDALDRARVAGLRVGRHRFVSFAPKVRIEPAEIDITEPGQRFEVRVVRDP